MHAVDLARTLQVRRVILPAAAGVFSAVGLLFSKLEVNETAPFLHRANRAPLDEAERVYGRLEAHVAPIIGGERARIGFARQADCRFAGQAFELTVPLPDGPLSRSGMDELCRRFEAAHLTRYGHAFSGEFPVEIVNLRLVGTRTPEGRRELRFAPHRDEGPAGQREAYFGPELGRLPTPVIGRSRLGSAPRRGPLILEEYEGTAVVPPDCTARLDRMGSVIIDLP
jgi:N-methylhydantoinase A